MSKLTTKNSFGVFPILFIKKNNKISATINSDIIPPLKDIKKCVYALSELFGEIKEMGENGIEEHNNKKQQEIEIENKKMEVKMKKDANERNDEDGSGFIYLLKMVTNILYSETLYKIGISQNPRNRLKKYTTENPFGIEVMFVKYINNYHKKEMEILEKFHNKIYRGEWMQLNEDDIKEIEKSCK